MNQIQFPLRQGRDVLAQQVRDLIVLLDIPNKRYISFDEVGSCMWKAALNRDSLDSAVEELLNQFDAEEPVIKEDFTHFLLDCLNKKLLFSSAVS